jgi:NAD(P)-dependent dehydrogenase (short-subunit alcohol dehydrogenase family)
MATDRPARSIIVTGGGSGVGRAVALAFAAEGDHVVVAGRDPGRLDATVEAASGLSGTVVAVPTDVRDHGAVAHLFDTTVAMAGRLDVLFNNAGMGSPPVPLDELAPEVIADVVATNLTGMFWCTREAMRVMKSQRPRGGRIINNGSISADRPRPNGAPYTATKHAVTGLTKSTILDGRSFDIAAGQIDIGNASTDMTAAMEQGILQPDGRIAVEPVMDVENVGRTVVHMASLPLDANVAFVTVMATTMPLYGRG